MSLFQQMFNGRHLLKAKCLPYEKHSLYTSNKQHCYIFFILVCWQAEFTGHLPRVISPCTEKKAPTGPSADPTPQPAACASPPGSDSERHRSFSLWQSNWFAKGKSILWEADSDFTWQLLIAQLLLNFISHISCALNCSWTILIGSHFVYCELTVIVLVFLL